MNYYTENFDFREAGQQAIEWVARYLEGKETYPVLSQVKPGDIRSVLPKEAPLHPETFEKFFDDFQTIILPGMTHWNTPGFMAYFAISGSAPSILGELLIAALDVNGMLWKTSPAATELEEVTMGWLAQMLGLPETFFGIIMDGASSASLCAMAAARESLNLGIREKGLVGRADLPKLTIYASEQAHSSIEKGAIVLGFGQENVRKIRVDEQFRMSPEALSQAIEQDIRQGCRPTCVVATIGTTSTTSVDPVQEILEICKKHKVWLHVDAAYAGAAAILPEKRPLFAGVEQADSFLMNPHKWLFVTVDCTAFYTRHPKILKQAFSLIPEYLRTDVEDEVHNLMDYGIQLGRRFRSLKLWMVLRMFGKENLQKALRKHIALAQQFTEWVKASKDFEVMAPVPFSTVCFRACPKGIPEEKLDDFNEALMNSINATGEFFLSHTKLHGQFVIRLSIASLRSETKHIARIWELLQESTNRLVEKDFVKSR